MELRPVFGPFRPVAPLAGSVDRNLGRVLLRLAYPLSLPSRGAWIEIWMMAHLGAMVVGRSPRGERG